SAFDIAPGSLASFQFDPVVDQVAGTSFLVTINAQDQYGNKVDTFTDVAILSDLSGSISPTSTANFIAGSWTGSVLITRAISGNRISATAENKSGTSNTFAVQPANFHHFSFQNITSPQRAGEAFSVTITALDSYDNVATSFNNSVGLTDSTGTISPSTTSAFVDGVWSGNVAISKSQKDVAVAATYGGVTSGSNLFNVKAGDVNAFSLSTIAGQTAGVPFVVQVFAKDVYGNQVEDFNETVNISDLSGTISPTVSGNFAGGAWSGSVTINQVQSNNMITVVRSSTLIESGNSNTFNVTPNSLDHFNFDPISSPQIAGVLFSVRIAAVDGHGNTVTGFSGTAGLGDLTGTISPGITGNFVDGVWTGSVSITKSQNSNHITASSGNKTGSSNNFDVNSRDVDHFRFQTISSPQIAGQKYQIIITAEDEYNNRVTSFNDFVNLSDPTGTLSPSVTKNFSSGQVSDSVFITQRQADLRLTASKNTALGYSNYFNVEPAPLDKFSIENIGTQAAGEPFNITVTAKDFYNNRVNSFTGKVDIDDLSGTISPSSSDNFDMGQWSGAVTVTRVTSSNQIVVTRMGGAQTGTSNQFDVVAGNVDHFDVNPISSPQTAGAPFAITIIAKDINGETVTSFAGTVNLIDNSGTISPTVTGNFVSGVWTGDVTITKSFTNNAITISGLGKSGISNNFNVNAAGADHFVFTSIASPQTAGAAFSVTVLARDQYDNIASSFNGIANLSDNTGTISPSATTNFSNGQWTGAVTITLARNDVEIDAQQAAISGVSNKFNVLASSLNRFRINNISSQLANEPFAITITALDAYDNTATSFSGKVDISDLTTTLTPVQSGTFVNGQWTGNVTVTRTRNNNTITVTRQGGSETGVSNSFDVTTVAVDHFVISAVGAQVAGQPFSITIRAEDSSNNLVTAFTGTVELSDLSGTLSPTASGNFIDGEWAGNLTITRSYSSNKITATGNNKTGVSNLFNVAPASLDHFRFQTINSPQVAGVSFPLTIQAKDAFDNLALSYSLPVGLTDNTGTISPSFTSNFSNGAWTGNVTITRSQVDVQIACSGGGKQGTSNSFNLNPASLNHFVVDSLNTQTAGVPFLLSVTAKDNYNNTVTAFTGSVDIADNTGVIQPNRSNNFSNGKWAGNVNISRTSTDNRIAVTRTGGTETGQSNLFDVISDQVDSFEFSNITGPITAGESFSVTITAKDSRGNLAVAFAGTVTLTDLSGTMSPKATTNFAGGIWTGELKVTRAFSNNRVFASGAGKSGESNQFDVIPAELDHFVFDNIASPQVAGQAFTIGITAKDSMNNTLMGTNFTADLSDNTGTISPSTTTQLVDGRWQGLVTINKKQTDVFITASSLGKTGQSNHFNVKAGPLAYLKIMDRAGGDGNEIGAISLTLSDQLTLYAAGFDGYDNYSRDINANWGVSGNLDLPNPLFGKSTVFKPTSPGTSGKIWADTSGVESDSTGLIRVSTPAYVKIRTAPNGEGVELLNYTMTADDTLNLFSAGYDEGDNFIGDAVVNWSSTGNLTPELTETGIAVSFQPTIAPASGYIIADNDSITADTTGLISVLPGKPTGKIVLTPNPQILPADGVSNSVIHSGIIYDQKNNPIAENTQFTVETTLGSIISTDVNPSMAGIQISADDSGKIQFTFQATDAGGTAFISVSSVNGSAYGSATVMMSSVNIEEIASPFITVSQGQVGVPVSMIVKNLSPNNITNVAAELLFTGPLPDRENRNSDFINIQRTDGITEIPSLSTRTLTFLVDVAHNARTDSVTIDGWFAGKIGSVSVSDTFATVKTIWRVQTKSDLRITRIYSVRDTVSQGGTGINVKMMVINEGESRAVVVRDSLKFWSVVQSADVTGDYNITPSLNNPQYVSGNGVITQFDYIVNVATTASLGDIEINGHITGSDENSGAFSEDFAADTTHSWFVKSAPIVGIKGFYPSQLQVTTGQVVPWKLTMIMENNGGTDVQLEKDSLFFLLRGMDVTPEYSINKPSSFSSSGNRVLYGNSVDTLIYSISQTGTSTGEITIKAAVSLRDLGTGKEIIDESLTGVTVLDSAKIRIVNLFASQTSVTRGQTQDWNIKVALSNDGGTDVEVDTLSSRTFIDFGEDADFVVLQPSGLFSGGLTLKSGAVDTLMFVVDRTTTTPG
ncbi:MAG: hypothetical protein SCK70_01370, partial [bacterium]|nr:hypothetical protein [bacterium]